jgi:hypothetical protein
MHFPPVDDADEKKRFQIRIFVREEEVTRCLVKKAKVTVTLAKTVIQMEILV